MKFFVYHFQVFLLIMIRLGAMVVIAPFYSSDIIPFRIKAAVCFMVTMIIFPFIAAKGYKLSGNMGEYFVMALSEFAIGIYLGFLVSVIFAAFQLAGEFFAVQIGFGINEVLDPLGQVSVPLVGQFKNLIGLLVFLAINGHHILLSAIVRSYELAPFFAYKKAVAGSLMKWLLYSFSGMFIVALKIALPVVAVVFLMEVSMGVLAKAAPQMNIMMLGFPFKIVVAFGVLFIVTPLIVRIMQVSLERTFNFIQKILVYWPT